MYSALGRCFSVQWCRFGHLSLKKKKIIVIPSCASAVVCGGWAARWSRGNSRPTKTAFSKGDCFGKLWKLCSRRKAVGVIGIQGKARGSGSAAQPRSPLSLGGGGNKVGIVRSPSARYNGALFTGCRGLEAPPQRQHAPISEFAFKRSCYRWQKL